MAVTKIHAIKSTLNKALAYIENPEKTDDLLLVSGYNVDPMMASVEMEMTSALAREANGGGTKRGRNLAYHMIQSFAPTDEVTPEQAHEIGKQLADNFLEGKYEYVISTHVDKGHIHNHIIFNAVSFYDLKKIETRPYKTAARIRAISDHLCTENSLSVIPKGQKMGYGYKEYVERKRNNSWKSELRKRLNYLLKMSTSYEELLKTAEQLGITINERGQELTYLLAGQSRCIRASKLSDEGSYQKDQIMDRVEKNKQMKRFLQAEIEKIVKGNVDYQGFLRGLKERGIEQRHKKSGEVVYQFNDMDGLNLPETVLGVSYTTEAIKRILRGGEANFNQKNADIISIYNKTSHSEIKDRALIALSIRDDLVDRVTADGLLLKLEGEGMVFIDNSHIELNAETGQYKIFIGSSFDYYMACAGADPDLSIADQLGSKTVKGENLIRKTQLAMGAQPEKVECCSVRSVTDNGVTIGLSDGSRCFIERDYVTFDRQSGRCWVMLYQDWTYSQKKEDKTTPISGRDLINRMAEVAPEADSQSVMVRRLKAAERRANIAGAAAVAEALMVIRQEGFQSVEDISAAISSLQKDLVVANQGIDEMQRKNEEYKIAAKYLLAYRETAPVQAAYEECSKFKREGFRRAHSEDLQKHAYAIGQLEKMGVSVNVDPEKVLELVRKQEQKIQEKTMENREREKKIKKLNETLKAVQEVKEERAKESNRHPLI